MLVSVIIPTYNRLDSLLRLLESLEQQTIQPDAFEVVVVDDGSFYESAIITERPYPFALQYIRQANSGATIARNNGAKHSSGDVLIVIDDDVTVSPAALEALADLCYRHSDVVVMGTLISCSNESHPSPFLDLALETVNKYAHAGVADGKDREIHFSWCNTQLLAVRRIDFFALDMLQDPTGGWPNWDDVDFGYRSHLAGYRLLQSGKATGYHWDNSLHSLEASCNRWQRASKSAVRLFKVHPNLQPHISMLLDKTPIVWSQDSPILGVKKCFRNVLASKLAVRVMKELVTILEKNYPVRKTWLKKLYFLIQGSYMTRGYCEGLQRTHDIQTEIEKI